MIGRVLQRHELEYDEAKHVLDSARESAQIRAAAQLDAESQAAKLVLRAQLQLAEMAVAQWKAGQAARVAEDMDSWITTHLTDDELGPAARL